MDIEYKVPRKLGPQPSRLRGPVLCASLLRKRVLDSDPGWAVPITHVGIPCRDGSGSVFHKSGMREISKIEGGQVIGG